MYDNDRGRFVRKQERAAGKWKTETIEDIAERWRREAEKGERKGEKRMAAGELKV